jgi:hypothetical protein
MHTTKWSTRTFGKGGFASSTYESVCARDSSQQFRQQTSVKWLMLREKAAMDEEFQTKLLLSFAAIARKCMLQSQREEEKEKNKKWSFT